MLSNAGTLFASHDRGVTFATAPTEKVAYLVPTANSSMAFMLPWQTTNHLWVTEDAGNTFALRLLPAVRCLTRTVQCRVH